MHGQLPGIFLAGLCVPYLAADLLNAEQEEATRNNTYCQDDVDVERIVRLKPSIHCKSFHPASKSLIILCPTQTYHYNW